MKDVDKLIIWFIPLFILEYLGLAIASMLTSYALESPRNDEQILHLILRTFDITAVQLTAYLTVIKPWINGFTHLLIGLWLFYISSKHGHKKFRWLFFGMLAGLLGVIIYFCAYFYDVQSSKTQK